MPSTQYIRRPASSYASCIWCATACASDYKAVTRDLKAIYQAPTEEAGQQALEAFAAARDSRYPQISRSWQANWPNLATFFAYPADIRKVIYTTNAIESLNSVIRHAIKSVKSSRQTTR